MIGGTADPRRPAGHDSIECAACGAKLRRDRKKCLRCGAPVGAAADEAAARRLSRSAATLLATSGLLAAAGFAFIFTRGVPDVGRQAPAPAVTAQTSEAARTPLQATTARAAYAPSQPAVVLAVSRDAAAAYSRGDTAAAVDDFSKAVAADPHDAGALNNLGQVLVKAGRVQEAIPYFDRAIEISAQTWSYRFNRARAYEELKQWGPAIADYRAAAQLFPDDYATQFNLGKSLEADGNLPDAIDAYQQAIKLAPGQPDFQLALGHALEAAGRPKDAAGAYRAYLDLQPAAPGAEKIKARIGQLDGVSSSAP